MAFWNPPALDFNPADPRYRTPPFQALPQSPGPTPFPMYASRGAYSTPSIGGRPPTAQARYAGGYMRRSPAMSPRMGASPGAGYQGYQQPLPGYQDPRTGYDFSSGNYSLNR
jgi:hypothetical protein